HPQFATHNAYTVAAVLELAPASAAYEFQRLHGMGEALYEAARAEVPALPPVRVYAPVGGFTELLPYLVRRLLENGANSSFVHQIADPAVPVDALVADPVAALPQPYTPDPRIRPPRELYSDRKNSLGMDLSRRDVLDSLQQQVLHDWSLPAAPATSAAALDSAIARAARAFESWSRTPAAERA